MTHDARNDGFHPGKQVGEISEGDERDVLVAAVIGELSLREDEVCSAGDAEITSPVSDVGVPSRGRSCGSVRLPAV